MFSKLMRCTKNCITCSQHWSIERAQHFCTTMPDKSHHQRFKTWMNWALKFCLVRHIHVTSHQSTTTSASIWTTFCRENAPTTNTSKVGQVGYEVLSHPPYSPDLLPIDYHFFKHFDNFLQGKCFHNQDEAENSFQKFVEFWITDFSATRINKLISYW